MSAITLLLGAAAGAAAAYFLDPDNGNRRRNMMRDQAMAKARRGARDVARQADYVAGKAKGAAVEAAPGIPGRDRTEDVDDVTLARKVESEIFREAEAPKGDVSVNVQDGIVQLRGMVADDRWRDRLAVEAGKVEGVKGVENLLHAPGTPAPSTTAG
jgi:osmotically-inducible protein OsmY